MALELTPLAEQQLTPAVIRAAGPNTPVPAKMMTAKGLAPMGPVELVTAIYQLSRDDDAQVATAADETASKLPDNILSAALAEPLDPRVLDYFARKSIQRAALIERILLNPYAHDETFVALAAMLQHERELEILAGNAQRVLRCPAIVEALYFNKSARMSTVDRLLEFAVRNRLQLEKIPNYKELAASILQSGAQQQEAAAAAMDDVFADVLTDDYEKGPVGDLEYAEDEQPTEEEEVLTTKISQMPITAKMRLASVGNMFHRLTLIRDSNRMVSMAVIRSPAVTEQEVQRYSGDRGLSEDIIRYIAERREWHKNYGVKLNLANNPKCPLAHSMRLLSHLRPNDVRLLSRSKNVPAPLVQAAKRLMNTRK